MQLFYFQEYCGELISEGEANRRGVIYDKGKCSYLYQVTRDLLVDATHYGNKIRFANHDNRPNCDCKIVKVNGDFRIGIYANRDLKAEEELFITYGYSEEQQKEVFAGKQKPIVYVKKETVAKKEETAVKPAIDFELLLGLKTENDGDDEMLNVE